MNLLRFGNGPAILLVAALMAICLSAMLTGIRDDFRRKAPSALVVEIEGPHFVFLAQGETAARYARTFLLEPSP